MTPEQQSIYDGARSLWQSLLEVHRHHQEEMEKCLSFGDMMLFNEHKAKCKAALAGRIECVTIMQEMLKERGNG